MVGIERQGDSATCGHINSGSSNVFINGRGVTRLFLDSAGGVINNPSSLNLMTVFVNGNPISILGDGIQSHGLSPHSSPTTANPSLDVVAY